MWVIDIRHWLDETQTQAAIPRLRLKVNKLSEIITYATSIAAGLSVESPPRCWRRPGRKPCKGQLKIEMNTETEQIHWICPECGDEGVVSGWAGLIWDMRDSLPGYLH
jgi:hypothetical protein